MVLGRGLKLWGVSGFNYMAQREVSGSIKNLVFRNPEALALMIEAILEARFSTHEVSTWHSHRILQLFHEVKDAILERQERGEFWKKILFRLFILDLLLVPKSS